MSSGSADGNAPKRYSINIYEASYLRPKRVPGEKRFPEKEGEKTEQFGGAFNVPEGSQSVRRTTNGNDYGAMLSEPQGRGC